jgi:hypothetical protein
MVRPTPADTSAEQLILTHVSSPGQGSPGQATLEQARSRLRELQATWAYAFAMGHGCSIGPDPKFHAVRSEVADLRAIIAEHTAARADA